MTMTTKPESRRVIDFGAHLYPDEVFPEEIYSDHPLADYLGPRLTDPEILAEEYKAASIDGAVISQPYYMGRADLKAVSIANDALIEIIEEYDQFYGLAAIPVAAGGEEAAIEFQRCLNNGYNGGAIETKSNGIQLTDQTYEPIFQVAEENGAPLLVHPKLHDTLHPEVLNDRYVLNAIFGREIGLAESICTVIHENVLQRHPNLNLVFHHYGGNIASMLGRIHLQLDNGRWPGRQDHVKDYKSFKSQLESRIYIDTSGFFGYDAPIRMSIEEIPTSQILFATDYPFEGRNPDELAGYVNTIDCAVSTNDADQILGKNALDLLTNTSA